jgi:hypothetical protein
MRKKLKQEINMSEIDMDIGEIHDLTVDYGDKAEHDRLFPHCKQPHDWDIEQLQANKGDNDD